MKNKTRFIILRIIIDIIILFILSYFFSIAYKAYKIQNSILNVSNSTGTIIEIHTGAIETGENIGIEKPNDPRSLLNYQMQYGENGIDYFIVTPTEQPKMNGKTSEENNNEMWLYLHNNRITFDTQNNKNGYILFIMKNKPKRGNNVFLGINGKTVGYLDKSKSLPTENDNELLYKYTEVPIIGNNHSWTENLISKSINAVVAEQNNKVEKIIVYFE